MRLIAAGLSFRSAPLAVRERAALDQLGSHRLLRYLVGHSGLSGALALSTCNRTEFYVTAGMEIPGAEIAARLARYLDPSVMTGEHLVVREGREAVTQLFRVAAGLDSMLIGEPQVLGQVRAAHRLAQEAGTLDADLDVVARRALTAGKAVRHRTALGRVRGGLGEAAVDVARQRVGPLAGRPVLLLGAGKVGRAAAAALQRGGADITVISRGHESAVALASAVRGHAGGGDLITVGAGIDVIISSTDTPGLVLDTAAIAAIQVRRGGRSLLLIDLAVPRDIDAAAAAVTGVELVDVDGLGRSIGIASAEAVGAAEAIVAAAVERTMAVLDERESSAPTIRELLGRAERVRREEVERTLSRLPGLGEEERVRIQRMSESLVAKLLHWPVRHLREVADDPAAVLRLRDAFDLDTEATTAE